MALAVVLGAAVTGRFDSPQSWAGTYPPPGSSAVAEPPVPSSTGADRASAAPGAHSNAAPPTGNTATTWHEGSFLRGTRQLTFDGRRSGEGYFSADGRQMVFQSERESDNPFYQIYLMDLESGDVARVSPGHGKTTCAWIHPSGQRVLFASTQFDPEAIAKQQAELEFRASGQTRRYSWDYDPQYELVEWDASSGEYRRLTDALGYDAEASYSPCGEFIVFASNRAAYSQPLSDRERELFEIDPSVMIDLYLCRSDGSDVRRLTENLGYDGGPFFSPDGSRICWRRFSVDGATAEIHSMNVDGTDQRQLTRLGAMSWAPFYHPSGEYLIFATNLQGFSNFELYLVDAAGAADPVRVTYTDGFDGLPVFTPDGEQLVWTSNRTGDGQSQLFVAQWDHQTARRALGLDRSGAAPPPAAESAGVPSAVDPALAQQLAEAQIAAKEAVRTARNVFSPEAIGRHIDYLCRPELAGRMTGTPGEQLATAYVASVLEEIGLEPAGLDGDWFVPFEFTAGVDLGPSNHLTSNLDTQPLELNRDWRPLVFSAVGPVPSSQVVFAGYGLVAPASGNHPEYDSYVHLDVAGKWVMVLRQLPLDISPERRQHLSQYSSLRFKAMAARERGAAGLIVVSGPTSQVRQQLVPLQLDGTLSGSSLAGISISDALAQRWLAAGGNDLEQLQRDLDSGEMMMGFELEGLEITSHIDVQQVKRTGRNVIGRLPAGDQPTDSVVIVGAHVDHLGDGQSGSSLADETTTDPIHYGADDNASGVAATLEIARFLATEKQAGRLRSEHDVLIAAWSGEELGLIGSSRFVDQFFDLYPHLTPSSDPAETVAPHGDADDSAADPHRSAPAHSLPTGSLYPSVVAYLNLDMVGRLRDELVLQGIGSSPLWRQEIERRNAVVGLPLVLSNDSYLPTDASSFFLRGVPILSAFTGTHPEYHTPRDRPELINYPGTAKIARLMGLIVRAIALRADPPEFVPQQAPEGQGQRARMTAYLGTIPDYAQGDIKGVRLSGVAGGGPAAQAGVQAGDIIVRLAGREIENIYDYTFAIEALRVGQETEIVVERQGERVPLMVTPLSRQ